MAGKVLIPIPIALAACSCRPYKVWFTIKNQSDKEINFTFYTLYPDTSINIGIIPRGQTIILGAPLGPGQEYTKGAHATLHEYFSSIPSHKLEIFIFDASVVRTTPWDSIVKNYLILRRYDLTEDSIRKWNGVITYP